MALDVSMEALLGHDGSKPTNPAGAAQPLARGRALSSEWYPAEGAALTAHTPRPIGKFDGSDGARFAVEHVAPMEHGVLTRERDLAAKLHELLASPFGEAVARILEETYRMLPQAHVVGN